MVPIARDAVDVARQAFVSRVVVLTAIVMSDWAIPDYDTSSTGVSLAGSCQESLDTKTQCTVPAFVERLVVWDAVFFVRIAECGYPFEQFHAFFPALPSFMWILKETALQPLVPMLCERGALIIAGFIISNGCFILAAVALHRLSVAVLGSQEHARVATMLFCWNPASVFCSVIYTESLYALATFLGMLALERGSLSGAVSGFIVSAATRSNGALNAGYILHAAARRALRCFEHRRWGDLVWTLSCAALSFAAILSPIAAFQWLGYLYYCVPSTDGASRPAWCEAHLPYMYGYVQSEFWGVGFLRYFVPEQVPNFALAAPVLLVSGAGAWSYLSSNWRRVPYLGLVADASISSPRGGLSSSLLFKPLLRSRQPQQVALMGSRPESSTVNRCFHRDSCFVYVVHWMVLAAVSLLVMHVQVATRFLCACPPLYWYLAHLWLAKKHKRLMSVYSAIYCAAGVVMHPNFYPWT